MEDGESSQWQLVNIPENCRDMTAPVNVELEIEADYEFNPSQQLLQILSNN